MEAFDKIAVMLTVNFVLLWINLGYIANILLRIAKTLEDEGEE